MNDNTVCPAEKEKRQILKMQYLPKDNMLVVLQEKTWKLKNTENGIIRQSEGQVGWVHSVMCQGKNPKPEAHKAFY